MELEHKHVDAEGVVEQEVEHKHVDAEGDGVHFGTLLGFSHCYLASLLSTPQVSAIKFPIEFALMVNF